MSQRMRIIWLPFTYVTPTSHARYQCAILLPELSALALALLDTLQGSKSVAAQGPVLATSGQVQNLCHLDSYLRRTLSFN